jgi:hypothetical protein
MKKAELFKILSDPNCSPKYVERALTLYSPEEILKIPAISLRSMYEGFSRSKTIDLWFKFLSSETINPHSITISYPYNLGFYLVSYYVKAPMIFFSSMSNINNKGLLKRLLPKFKCTLTQENRAQTKRIYFSLYAYNLVSKSELLKTLSINGPVTSTSVYCPAKHTLHKCENLFKRILSRSQDLDLTSQFLMLECVCSENVHAFLLDMSKRVLQTHFPSYKWTTFLDQYREHLRLYSYYE